LKLLGGKQLLQKRRNLFLKKPKKQSRKKSLGVAKTHTKHHLWGWKNFFLKIHKSFAKGVA
jgi:hypothetical protein